MEIFILYLFVFILGLFIGSFLGVIIDRLPFDRSIIFPASHCPHCRHKLHPFDLIPVFSYLILDRKCRYCSVKISAFYPLVELVTASIFLFVVYNNLNSSPYSVFGDLTILPEIIYLLVVISSFIVVFFIDLKYGIIPFKIVLFALTVILIKYIFSGFAGIDILSISLSAVIVFSIFFLLFYFSKGRAIGFGDVVFSFLMGFFLGFPKIILAVYLAFLTGAGFSLILVLLGKKKLKGGTIPFGPFLVLGTLVSLFWGQNIIDYFLQFIYVS